MRPLLFPLILLLAAASPEAASAEGKIRKIGEERCTDEGIVRGVTQTLRVARIDDVRVGEPFVGPGVPRDLTESCYGRAGDRNVVWWVRVGVVKYRVLGTGDLAAAKGKAADEAAWRDLKAEARRRTRETRRVVPGPNGMPYMVAMDSPRGADARCDDSDILESMRLIVVGDAFERPANPAGPMTGVRERGPVAGDHPASVRLCQADLAPYRIAYAIGPDGAVYFSEMGLAR